MRASITWIGLLVCVCVGGCDMQMADDDPQPGPDAAPPAPVVDYSGTYAVEGTWDLSGPLSADEGIGGTVAVLVIDQVISAAGVPTSLEGMAREKLAAVAHEPIRDYVNGQLPADWRPGGATMDALTAVLASADVESTMTVSGAGDSISGTDEIETVTMSHEGTTAQVQPEVPVVAQLSGRRTTGGFEVDVAVYQLRYDAMVEQVLAELLGVDTVSLSEQIASAIDCPAITNEVTGGSGQVELTVSGETVTISAARITEGCNALAVEAADYALGLFAKDTPVSAGGPVNAPDADADLEADSITAGAGYGGSVAVVHPLLDPALSVRFTGDRR